ncbi:gamma-glutamyltranspeptidase/glutathione hydrolase [Stella humosa]|uniref:Gamma-glutamyltranspeptidase/glutathione hydrolase n=1 Tax=Stella humosa TaxID=94 RepID=A0A3N1MH63_9PROT|nr:gamma-glutamyltransferase [Stella humosa]ROQ03083.1 gamma-glutamyltranspeptidase/glutathione hydrolase [Stella humosa]BBK34236.1 gamma-glutamyltranspeptidase [Stella humosa]
MLQTAHAQRGMITAPHHLAAQAGLAVLRDGGNAVEAMVAAAAAIAVVYPHMNAIGGDGFWLIAAPGTEPVAIRACGAAAGAATIDLYRRAGHATIPARGPLAALTVPGTVSGWAAALDLAAGWDGRPLPLERLLEEATHYAIAGVPVTASQARYTALKMGEMAESSGFGETFLPSGRPPVAGQVLANPALGQTLRRLARDGLDGFYRGDLARSIAADLARAGSPLAADDLARHRAARVRPLAVGIGAGTVFNHPPPTQGLSSLMILALWDRLGRPAAEGFAHVHALVEATKRAFLVRDAHVGCPSAMARSAEDFLTEAQFATDAAAIDPARAAPWPQQAPAKGDTIWMGAVDGAGRAVSFIQSIYWEFGSGVVLRDTGLLMQNRGASFQLEPAGLRALAPGRLPFHTLNPALARLGDGRTVTYGTMGGEGQPQTQAAILTRLLAGQAPQQAVTAPRWLLGRTWGAEATNLKIEDQMADGTIQALRRAGHDVEMVEGFSDLMGHAGMIVHGPDGVLSGAADPRADGIVAAF